MGLFRRSAQARESAGPALYNHTHGAAKCTLTRASLVFDEDILPSILDHLSPRDLVSCLRVNQSWFEAAGKLLYEEVAYGKEPRTGRPDILSDLEYVPPLAWLPRKDRIPDVIPSSSPTKPALLRHVKRIKYYSHPTSQCGRLIPNRAALFPSLETLTIYYQMDLPPWHWSCRILTGLQPKHVRIADIPGLRSLALPIPLNDVYPTCEKITIHLHDCFRAGLHSESSPGVLSVDWPRSMQQLDLLFMRSWPWTATADLSSDDARAWEPLILDYQVDEAAQSVAEIILSAAGLKAAVRLIGLGKRFRSSEAEVEQDVLAERFETGLRRVYKDLLLARGLDGTQLQERVEALKLLTLEEYWNQGGRCA